MTVRTGSRRFLPTPENAVLLLPAGAAAGVVVAAYSLGGASLAGLLLHVVALGAVTTALGAARRRRREAERLSGDLDAVAHRLLRLETLFADAQRQDGRAARAAAEEVSGEIALLGNLVRDLAETVAAHDRDLSRTRSAEPAPAAEPVPRRDPAGRAERAGRGAPDGRTGPSEPSDWTEFVAQAERARVPSAPRAEPDPWAEPIAWAEPTAPPILRPTLPFDAVAVEAERVPGWLRGSLDPEPLGDDAPPASPQVAPAPIPRPEPPALEQVARPRASEASAISARVPPSVAALGADRLDIHLQPIVTLPQRKVRAYEVLARLRDPDGSPLEPAEFLPALEAAGLSDELDRRVLAKAAAVAGFLAARGGDALLHCNLSPRSLGPPALRALGRALDALPALSGRLVLEIPQRAWRDLDGERAGALSVLRDRGVLFALDRATDGRLDPQALADRGVRFVKLSADLLLRAGGRGSDLAASDLAAALSRAGIRLVAERVERGDDVPDLIELDVPLAQGFAFAPPRPVRTDLGPAVGGPATASGVPASAQLGAASMTTASPTPDQPTPEPSPPAPPSSGPGGERLPYRAFLRRAG